MTEDALKAAHSFLVNRVYLESELLNARVYNFATITGFLIAGYALGAQSQTERLICYLVAILGLGLSLFNFSLGVLNAIAIDFWREYLRRVEHTLGLKLDAALFEFYEKPEGVETFVGVIQAVDKGQLKSKTIPWCWRAARTPTHVFGGWIPALLSLFWYFIIARLVCKDVGGTTIVWVVVCETVVLLACGFTARQRLVPSVVLRKDLSEPLATRMPSAP